MNHWQGFIDALIIVFVVILLVLLTTVGVLYVERRADQRACATSLTCQLNNAGAPQ